MNRDGEIVAQQSYDYPLIQSRPGYSEQNPEDWVSGTTVAIVRLILNDHIKPAEIAGISFSGQMHGLVLLDENNQVLRPAILWNDTRTTKQCEEITAKLGDEFIDITKNKPLEGFTLPKMLWVKENEPSIWAKAKTFLLPKDYVRYRMTGQLGMDYSDATGTVLLDVKAGQWSQAICDAFDIPMSMCPPLMRSIDSAGKISDSYAIFSGLDTHTEVFGGAADNAAGAVGAGILSPNMVLSSIGTSGVVLKYEEDPTVDYHGVLQFEDHAIPDSYYSMGVTLAAGYSLNWFKRTFAQDESFNDMVAALASQLSVQMACYTRHTSLVNGHLMRMLISVGALPVLMGPTKSLTSFGPSWKASSSHSVTSWTSTTNTTVTSTRSLPLVVAPRVNFGFKFKPTSSTRRLSA